MNNYQTWSLFVWSAALTCTNQHNLMRIIILLKLCWTQSSVLFEKKCVILSRGRKIKLNKTISLRTYRGKMIGKGKEIDFKTHLFEKNSLTFVPSRLKRYPVTQKRTTGSIMGGTTPRDVTFLRRRKSLARKFDGCHVVRLVAEIQGTLLQWQRTQMCFYVWYSNAKPDI